MLANYDYPSQIIAAAIRNSCQIATAALAGAHCVTAAMDVYRDSFHNPYGSTQTTAKNFHIYRFNKIIIGARLKTCHHIVTSITACEYDCIYKWKFKTASNATANLDSIKLRHLPVKDGNPRCTTLL